MALTLSALMPLSLTPRRAGLSGVEKATLAYLVMTTAVIAIMAGRLADVGALLLLRAAIAGGLVLTVGLYRLRPCRLTLLLRYLFPLSLLSVWYPDTYAFCSTLPYLDHVFAAADQWLFGCQPALTFSAALPQKIWSELYHLGYFSYYLMIAGAVLSPLFLARERFSRTAFIVMATFFLYYTIYLFLPVAGPQYYFCAIGLDQAAAGHFPAVADGYFALHQQMLPSPGPDGLFRTLVEQAQAGGERPTAAFPSSHVGAATVLLLLMYRTRRSLPWLMIPLYLPLVGATLYTQAHYLLDVFGGLATGVLFYIILDRLYPHVERRFAGTRPPFA